MLPLLIVYYFSMHDVLTVFFLFHVLDPFVICLYAILLAAAYHFVLLDCLHFYGIETLFTFLCRHAWLCLVSSFNIALRLMRFVYKPLVDSRYSI